MSARARVLAEQFEQVNAEVLATIEVCGDGALQGVTTTEGWPIPFAVWHIADGHTAIMDLISVVASERPPPPLTTTIVDAINADKLARHEMCSRREAFDLLRQNGVVVATTIRQLTDVQLDHPATIEYFAGAPISVQYLIERALFGHVRRHLESIRAVCSR